MIALLLSLLLFGSQLTAFELPVGLSRDGLPMPADPGVGRYPPPMQIYKNRLYVLNAALERIEVYDSESSRVRRISVQPSALSSSIGRVQDFAVASETRFYLAAWESRSLIRYESSVGLMTSIAQGDTSRDYFRSVGRPVFRDGILMVPDYSQGSVRLFASSGSYLGNLAGGGIQMLPLAVNEVLRVEERGELSVIEKVSQHSPPQPFYELGHTGAAEMNSLHLIGVDRFARLYVEELKAHITGERKSRILQFSMSGKLLKHQIHTLSEREYFEFEEHYLLRPEGGVLRIQLEEKVAGKERLKLSPVEFSSVNP